MLRHNQDVKYYKDYKTGVEEPSRSSYRVHDIKKRDNSNDTSNYADQEELDHSHRAAVGQIETYKTDLEPNYGHDEAGDIFCMVAGSDCKIANNPKHDRCDSR